MDMKNLLKEVLLKILQIFTGKPLYQSLFFNKVAVYKETLALQTHHADSVFRRRGNDRFHVVSTWNTRGVFVCLPVDIAIFLRILLFCRPSLVAA